MSYHVPSELVANILDFATISTLANAAQCSRQWYDIAVARLYPRVDINKRGDETSQHNHALRVLTVVLLRKPQLAALVQHFSIRPFLKDDLMLDRSPFPRHSLPQALALTNDLEPEIKAAIQSTSQSSGEHAKWLEEAKLEDSLLALVIPLLTNLESLDIEIPIEPTLLQRTLHRIARQETPFNNLPLLSNLHSFVWAYHDSQMGGNLTDTCFLLPSVRAVYFHRIASLPGSGDTALTRVRRGSSLCTTLEMKDCRFNDADIESILSIPKALSTFIYEIGWSELGDFPVIFAAIRAALEAQKENLVDLCLGFGHEGPGWDESEADDEPEAMGSFENFTKLKRLRIAPDFVFGANLDREDEQGQHYWDNVPRLLKLLPPSIESLHITHGDTFRSPTLLYEAMELLLEHKDAYTPCLHTITLDTTMSRIRQHRARIRSLLRVADNAGLPVKFINTFRDERTNPFVERKWGMDEDIEWVPCSSHCNRQPVYEAIDMRALFPST